MQVRLLQTILLLVLFQGLCFAQTISWQEINGPPGFSLLREGADEKLFGVRGSFGFPSGNIIYTSTDKGLTWSENLVYSSSNSFIELQAKNNWIVAKRYNPNVVNSYAIHLSTDNGLSWSRISSSPDYFINTNLMVSDSGYLYAVDQYEVQFSRYRQLARYDGVQWNRIGNTIPFFAGGVSTLAIDRLNTIYLGTSGSTQPGPGLFISTDYGTTWRLSQFRRNFNIINVSVPNKIIVGTVPIGAIDGGIFVSTDGGTSWAGMGITDKIVSSVAVDSSGIMFASTDDGVYRYNAVEENWDPTELTNNAYDALLITKSNRIVTTSSTLGVFYSTDQGRTWIVSGPKARDVVTMTTNDSGYIFAGTLGGRIFVSTNRGTSWSQVPSGLICDYIYSIVSYGSEVYVGTDCGVYKTTDNGESWQNISKGYINGSAYALAVKSNGELFAGTNFGVYRSTDGGLVWQSSGFTNATVSHLTISNTDELFASTENAGIFSSTDNGDTWISRGLVRNDFQTLAVNSSGHVFAGVYGGIVRSTDGGTTWEEKRFDESYVYALAFSDPQTIFAGTYNGVFVSYNNGDSWSPLSTLGLAARSVLSLAIDPEGNLLAGTYRGGVYRTTQPAVAVKSESEPPTSFQLYQNYPNPFNPVTVIRYHLPAGQVGLSVNSRVMLKVYNVLGREVATLVNEKIAPGEYTVSWDASGQPSGVYLYRLNSDKFVDMRKMLLVK